MPGPGTTVRIEAMTGAHAAAVLAIYQAGIDEGNQEAAAWHGEPPTGLSGGFPAP